MATKAKDTHGSDIKGLAMGASKSLVKVSGGGTVEARRISSGVVFYWRHTESATTQREPIGAYDSKAPPDSIAPKVDHYGYSVEAAKRAAERMAIAHHAAKAAGQGGYREAKTAQRLASKAAMVREKARKDHTLEGLLQDYCAHLKSLGRRSHLDASCIFRLHICDARPKIAGKPACEVTKDDVLELQRRLNELGHLRTSNKLRSYMRAAFQVAIDAAHDASIPIKFRDYAIERNPVADTKRNKAGDKSAKNPLTHADMRIYWSIIKDVPNVKGIALRLHLLTGAPRVEQLVKANIKSLKDGYLELMDAKGRPGKGPRPHAVPLVGRAMDDVKSLTLKGEFLMSTDDGDSHIAATTLSDWAKDLVGDKIVGFQVKRLRSGVETLLASAGVSREVRGYLQSHGIGGVQATHYNAHDYMPEKVDALKKLHALLEIEPVKKGPPGRLFVRKSSIPKQLSTAPVSR